MSIKTYLYRKKKRKEYSKFIKLRYEAWKKEQKTEEEQLQEQFNSFQNMLKEHLQNCTSESEKEKLHGIYDIKCETKEDLEDKVFLFNDGLLQSDEIHNYVMNKRFVINNNLEVDYNKQRHKINTIAFLLPFFTTLFGIVFGIKENKGFEIIVLPIALIPALIAGLIGYAIGNTINIDNAKTLGLPDDDPRVADEKLKRAATIASIGISVYSTGKAMKDMTKDIADVDNWKVMK